MSFAMIGAGREYPSAIEIDIETEFSWLCLQLADELAFIVIEFLVEIREFLRDSIVNALEDCVGYGVVVVIDLLRHCVARDHGLGGLGRCEQPFVAILKDRQKADRLVFGGTVG